MRSAEVGPVCMGGGGAWGRSESQRRNKWVHGAAGASLSHHGTGQVWSRGVEETRAREWAQWAACGDGGAGRSGGARRSCGTVSP